MKMMVFVNEQIENLSIHDYDMEPDSPFQYVVNPHFVLHKKKYFHILCWVLENLPYYN